MLSPSSSNLLTEISRFPTYMCEMKRHAVPPLHIQYKTGNASKHCPACVTWSEERLSLRAFPPLPTCRPLPLQSFSSSASQAWRPWSIPVDIHRVQRRLRGLLNKITAANFDSISDNVVALAASVERTGDTRSINIFAYSLVERSILNENLTGVLVKLCQKLVDELEGSGFAGGR
ncbi:hypothetical protein A0H81_10449 [Grifola frondosa]|uniref:MIF4G domain-containing protein n=1 Tax=Grifola frondosa TaxID=5627 RepID=A0A1C7M3L4_GRIFR|nr:hypothetical protein A0H81_10449 [Grifola frondosa]